MHVARAHASRVGMRRPAQVVRGLDRRVDRTRGGRVGKVRVGRRYRRPDPPFPAVIRARAVVVVVFVVFVVVFMIVIVVVISLFMLMLMQAFTAAP